MDNLDKLLIAMGILAAFAVGMAFGTFYPSIVNDEPMVSEYLTQHDRGCDEILVNEVLGRPYCVVGMEHEDDALYIIKKAGAYDDY